MRLPAARPAPTSFGRRALRIACIAVVAFLVGAAGCPLRQSDREPSQGEVPIEEVRLRVGESTRVAGGELEVSIVALDYGNRIAELTLRLAGPDGRSVQETIEVVRNARLSEAVRLEPYSVRVVGFPGVDSALLQVTREDATGEGGGRASSNR